MTETQTPSIPGSRRLDALGVRPFAWAGVELDVPTTWRLLRVEGNARRGSFVLADTTRVKLEIAWARVTRRKFDGHAFATRQLRRAVDPKGKTTSANERFQIIDNAGFTPLLFSEDQPRDCEHYVGYSPRAKRVVELVLTPDQPREDQLIRESIRRTLNLRAIGDATPWALFTLSFITPEAFVYHDSTLNMGDLSVTLTNRRSWRCISRLTVREIYPASLALARRDLKSWTIAIVNELAGTHRPRRQGFFSRRYVEPEPIHTPLGPGFTLDTRARIAQRPFRFRTPVTLRTWLIHHEQHNRLSCIQIADDSVHREQVYDFIVKNLHWANLVPPRV